MSRISRWGKPFAIALVVSVGVATLALALFARWATRGDRPSANTVAWQLQQRQRPKSAAELQRLWQVPTFHGRAQDGGEFDDRALRGRVWLADFIYTRCTSACPLLTARLVMIGRRLPPGLGLLSFSVDPKNDDPATLAAYEKRWPRPDRPWTLVTTGDAGIEDLAQGMRVMVDRSPTDPDDILHTTHLFLIDAAGWVRGIYDSESEAEVTNLVADANLLAGTAASAIPRAALTGTDGARLFADLGCTGCHGDTRLAPALGGFGQRPSQLEGGGAVASDRAYLHQSIVEPAAKVVKGYGATMPSYASVLSDAQVDAVAGYLLTLPPPVTAAATGTAIDPVCHMTIPVVADTVRVHRGDQTFYFCSSTCRAKFESAPQRYLAKATGRSPGGTPGGLPGLR